MAETKQAAQIGYTDDLADLLRSLKATLLISTYESNGLVSIWPRDGKRCGISHAELPKPMGMAWRDGQLAVAAKKDVWQFRQLAGFQPEGATDAFDHVFLPVQAHFTNEILTHEIAWGSDHLWIVNTLFSCLARTSPSYSFEPLWQPPFISGLEGVDKCHLNGLAMAEGKPAYVTALSETDTRFGWRDDGQGRVPAA